MTFREAVLDSADICDAYKKGLQALGRNTSYIKVSNSRLCEGSVDIDTHLEKKYPKESRWDYVIGHKGVAEFIEIHPASTSNISEMISKYNWLKNWLNKRATKLNQLQRRIHWVASGKVAITRNSRQLFLLAQNGLPKPVKYLELK